MTNTVMFEAMSAALGRIASATYPDTVTFRRPVNVKGSDGGNIVNATGNPTNPQSIPVLIKPATGQEIMLAGKPVSGTAYMLRLPSLFRESLVDVDATCLAQVAARPGGEEGRAFQIQWIGRLRGLEIGILGTLEE